VAVDSLNDDVLVMGRIASPYGVKGWVRINSFTSVPDSLLDYTPWYLNQRGQWQAVELLAGKRHGKGLVVHLKSCDDRDAAAALTGTDIGVYRSQLPPADEDEYYWSDLVGLQVINLRDQVLGVVDHLFETGANDVMVVKGEQECLVPYIQGQVIESVDLDKGMIRVDWDPDFQV
jgi:16S rRNA processing protein RimM